MRVVVVNDPYVNLLVAHIKRCHMCRRHDRLVAEGRQYPDEVLLERFAAHVRATIARIKMATEDAQLREDYDRTQLR